MRYPQSCAPAVRTMAALLGAAAILVLTGCSREAVRQEPPPPRSMLDAEAEQLRTRLRPEAVPLKGSLWYRPVARCRFVEARSPGTAGNPATMTVKPLANRLLLTKIAGKDVSTVLLDRQGKLYDYNIIDPVTRRRVTPESSAADARRRPASPRGGAIAASASRGVVWLPEFKAASAAPGDTIATVVADDGSIWGRYVYRGGVTYRNSPGAVVDIVREPGGPHKSGAVLAGFTIINLRTMLPLLHVLSDGSGYRLEQVECASTASPAASAPGSSRPPSSARSGR